MMVKMIGRCEMIGMIGTIGRHEMIRMIGRKRRDGRELGEGLFFPIVPDLREILLPPAVSTGSARQK
jgi:hypothetical protein